MKALRAVSAILILILCTALLTGCNEQTDTSDRPNADRKTGTPKELGNGDIAPEFTLTC